MKTVLCYGDSNTWGYDASSGKRFGRDTRWTGVLQGLLGNEFHVIEEGLCGRTAANSTAVEPEVNGLASLPVCLKSHAPLDYFVVMLGGNDLQLKYGAVPLEIARCVEKIVQVTRNPYSHGLGAVPTILVISPPPVGEGICRFFLRDLFGGVDCIERSVTMARRIRAVALTYGCLHLDAGAVVKTCEQDGLHLDAANHRLLAEAVRDVLLGSAGPRGGTLPKTQEK